MQETGFWYAKQAIDKMKAPSKDGAFIRSWNCDPYTSLSVQTHRSVHRVGQEEQPLQGGATGHQCAGHQKQPGNELPVFCVIHRSFLLLTNGIIAVLRPPYRQAANAVRMPARATNRARMARTSLLTAVLFSFRAFSKIGNLLTGRRR